jgi:hypothetical protein
MLFTVTRRPHVFTLQFGLPFVTPLNPRALPLGRLTKRTPTHIPVPPPEPCRRAPRGLVWFLNSFFSYVY